jgi:hypothetical protein
MVVFVENDGCDHLYFDNQDVHQSNRKRHLYFVFSFSKCIKPKGNSFPLFFKSFGKGICILNAKYGLCLLQILIYRD